MNNKLSTPVGAFPFAAFTDPKNGGTYIKINGQYFRMRGNSTMEYVSDRIPGIEKLFARLEPTEYRGTTFPAVSYPGGRMGSLADHFANKHVDTAPIGNYRPLIDRHHPDTSSLSDALRRLKDQLFARIWQHIEDHAQEISDKEAVRLLNGSFEWSGGWKALPFHGYGDGDDPRYFTGLVARSKTEVFLCRHGVGTDGVRIIERGDVEPNRNTSADRLLDILQDAEDWLIKSGKTELPKGPIDEWLGQ